jgi:hypothetical protein
MAEPSFADQMASLNSTLSAIEVRLALGRAPSEGLEGFKSALDDMRLRLWGLLSAGGGPDARSFQEQFRIRRAMEMCSGLSGDLHAGNLSGRHPELIGLRVVAAELADKIEQAQRDAF